MKYIERSVYVVVTIIALLAINAPAWAEEEQFPDHFMLRVGGYAVGNASTTARLDSNRLPVGAYIDFSDDLGGEKSTTAGRVDGLFRFNDKHGIGFSWYALKLNGSRSLDRDINWGDQTFPIHARVDSEIKFDVYKLNYQYSLFHNEKAELGVLFGFHVMRTSAGISAIGINKSQSESVTAPLPVWGLFGEYKFTPRFSAYYNYQMFFISYDDKIKGGLQDFLVGMEYRVLRNVALGAAYNRFSLNAEAKGDTTTLSLDTNWNGGLLYAAVYF
jgi:hypothetical protein